MTNPHESMPDDDRQSIMTYMEEGVREERKRYN